MNRRFALVVGVRRAGLVGCMPRPAVANASTAASADRLTVGLGYIPSVQFAQFYRAQQQGYYRDAGPRRDVPEPDRRRAGHADRPGRGGHRASPTARASSRRSARASRSVRRHDLRRSSRTSSSRRADSGIETPRRSARQALGIPGRYGSSWIMLQALLASAGLTPDDVDDPRSTPTSARRSRCAQGQVDAATGFANNEPVQLALAGHRDQRAARRRDHAAARAGPDRGHGDAGREAGRAAGVRRRDAARDGARSRPTRRSASTTTIAAVPDLGRGPRDSAGDPRRDRSPCGTANTLTQHGLGAIDSDAWSESIEFMQTLPELGVKADLTADQLLTEDSCRDRSRSRCRQPHGRRREPAVTTHGHAEPRLGPIDWQAWFYAVAGVAAGLLVVAVLLAQGRLTYWPRNQRADAVSRRRSTFVDWHAASPVIVVAARMFVSRAAGAEEVRPA